MREIDERVYLVLIIVLAIAGLINSVFLYPFCFVIGFVLARIKRDVF